MQHRIFEPDSTQKNDYSKLSDEEKNSRILAHLCQVIENTCINDENGVLRASEETIEVINATAKFFDISIRFNVGDSVLDIQDKLQMLLGGTEDTYSPEDSEEIGEVEGKEVTEVKRKPKKTVKKAKKVKRVKK